MTSISSYLKFLMVLILQETFCTDLPPDTEESINHVADHQKLHIGADVFNSIMENSKKSNESDYPYSSSSYSEFDSCNSNSTVDDDDEKSKMTEDFSFKRSTIVYLMKIIKELKNISTKVTVPLNRPKYLKFIDNAINLIDLFEKVILHRKDDTAIIFKDKIENVISNIVFLDDKLPDFEKMLTEDYVFYGKNSELKKIIDKMLNLRMYYNELKVGFKEYNNVEKQNVNFDLTKSVEALNEYKEKLHDKKIKIYNMNDEDVEKQHDDFLKDSIEVYKSLYKCLKTEYHFVTIDFSILNNYWNGTNKFIDDLVTYVTTFNSIEKSTIIFNTTCAIAKTSGKFIPPKKRYD